MIDIDEDLINDALNRFGEIVVRRVRDESVEQWMKILNGRAKGATAESLRPELSRLNRNQIALIERLVPMIVDTVLHHLLWTLEQVEDVDISVQLPNGVVPSLREVSDGLAGELYDWIEWFSSPPK